MKNDKLKLTVYHKEILQRTEENFLIGGSEIDLSSLLIMDDVKEIDGYYHITKEMNPKELNLENSLSQSLGQLKINIKSSHCIKQLLSTNNYEKNIELQNTSKFGTLDADKYLHQIPDHLNEGEEIDFKAG